jgi:hypothetical protein
MSYMLLRLTLGGIGYVRDWGHNSNASKMRLYQHVSPVVSPVVSPLKFEGPLRRQKEQDMFEVIRKWFQRKPVTDNATYRDLGYIYRIFQSDLALKCTHMSVPKSSRNTDMSIAADSELRGGIRA